MSQIPGLGFRDHPFCMPKRESRSSRMSRSISLRIDKPSPQPASKRDEIPKKSLIALLPKTGYLLVAVCIAAAAVSSLILSGILDASQTTRSLVLSIICYLSSSIFIISVAFCNGIRQAPQSPGLLTFVFFFIWVVIQILCFFNMKILWSQDWPTDIKNLAVAWMLLSLASIAIYIFALIRIMAVSRKDLHSKKLDLEAAKPASPWAKGPWDHAELGEPQPPVYTPRRENLKKLHSEAAAEPASPWEGEGVLRSTNLRSTMGSSKKLYSEAAAEPESPWEKASWEHVEYGERESQPPVSIPRKEFYQLRGVSCTCTTRGP
ncbi:hypothetical protein GCG54_00007440 [Colletotrichum gloeosporioides]|uniref:Uncharacterized protein n=1 Tax=Colletotrichum gloeosporioides TaxID=474922 RepID=A0A8H4FML5_COLGL|nr:uncharacterized protein GCG54_00007440 [Colletotrichum gloeosporioides]KAF3807707.1 hypothetical protein GCG54_00007440 [Colletotrichum gloeosporioides]